jgi:ribosomal protein L11 methyltransferase
MGRDGDRHGRERRRTVIDEPRYPEVWIDVPLELAEEAAAELFDLGASGVEHRDEGTLVKATTAGLATLVASFADRSTAEAAVTELDPSWSPRVGELVGDAWRDAWKEHFVPFRLTERITVRPPWHAYERRSASEIVLELEPGRAFGTGLHATTSLVAEALEALGERLAGSEVLDVGTGSGILALVAIALGAGRAQAIDVDPDAVAVTLENALRNQLETSVDASATPLSDVRGDFDVVVANIEARVLIDLSADLAARVRPHGTLILSGILEGQETDVLRAFNGFALKGNPHRGEWVALVLERDRPSL